MTPSNDRVRLVSSDIAVAEDGHTPADETSAARLCAACGLCCNGVMFHTVKLQPNDSAPALAALGLKLKRKQGHHYILQPCPAFGDAGCSIYAARPERCRLFECQQLQRVAAGETTEALALEKIRDVQRRVAELEKLLERAGSTNVRRPLTKRCEQVMAEPLGEFSTPAAHEQRAQLTAQMQELKNILNRDFRLTPTADAD
jgi:Fe-S-cluster containining protein